MCSWISKHKMRRRAYFRVTCGKTSKIISNLFSITFSTCVFWSQHAFSPLLSPFNRWLKHMEICLSASQIKCNNEKKNPQFFGMKTFWELYLGDLPLWSSSLLLSTVLSQSNCRHTCQACFPFPPLTKYAPLCACEDWSTAGPQAETRRQEYYCWLSRKKAD